MCCVAINGYHSCAVYQWRSASQSVVVFEQSPLFYCTIVSEYTCTVTLKGSEQKKDRTFHVYSELIKSLVTFKLFSCFTGRQNDGQLCVNVKNCPGEI